MNSRESEILEKIINVLKENLSPDRILLFGSRAKDINSEQADFDIAVNSEKPVIEVQRKISEEIEEISGLYKVDVVYIPSVDKEFKEIILKTGKVLYEQ